MTGHRTTRAGRNGGRDELADARVVDFPLQGEWTAMHSPGSRIPSHGTNQLAQRFAFDIWRVDHRKSGYHPARSARLWLRSVPTRECYGWGEPVHAAADGEVVTTADGVRERATLNPMRELLRAIGTGLTLQPARVESVLGNHVIIRGGDVYVLYAHLAPGTVAVRPGQAVHKGDVLGRVGCSGNSTAPHLHFQLMDAADILTAGPVPCVFAAYEVQRDGAWEHVERGVPLVTERIRSVSV